MNKLTDLLARYRKFGVALAAALAVLGLALSDGQVSGIEWGEIISTFLGAAGVNVFTNKVKINSER